MDELKNRVFADQLFVDALQQPHDKLMNRLAASCNYDYHRVQQAQCSNASGRYIADVLGQGCRSNLSAGHVRTFVQAALTHKSKFVRTADHKERFTVSCAEPANDVCNEGFYGMLQMCVLREGHSEVPSWDAEPAQRHIH